jgi:hypothetical protein
MFTKDELRVLVLFTYSAYLLKGIDPTVEQITAVIKRAEKEIKSNPEYALKNIFPEHHYEH